MPRITILYTSLLVILLCKLGHCNEALVKDLHELISTKISKSKYTDVYLARISSYDEYDDEMYRKFQQSSLTKMDLSSDNVFANVSGKRISRLAVKSHSYLVFLFEKNQNEGLALHYHESYGSSVLKVSPSVNIKGYVMISGHFRNFYSNSTEKKSGSRTVTFYGVKIEGWNISKVHKTFIAQVAERQKRP